MTQITKSLSALSALVALAIMGGTTAYGEVVDLAKGAGDTQAYYSNWGADNANADSPAASSYNNYRKGRDSGNAPGLPMVTDNGDGLSATWTNVSHGGGAAAPCCGNPGMFFGQSPSTSSYSDAQLFLRSNAEVGIEHDFDSNGRRRFDVRFGFTESPSDWIAGRTANDGSWDLWTNDHKSDTVYLQANVGATDGFADAGDTPLEVAQNLTEDTVQDNQYVWLNQDVMGQSGNAPAASLRHEQDRDRWHKNELGISAGPATAQDSNNPDLGVLELAGLGRTNATFDTGVGYDGDVPVDWWMELNDPGNADPALARQVAFNVKFGGITFSQVFDPGGTDAGAEDDVVPNPTNDPDNAFVDGYFDWQNATPVFFVAPSGGAENSTMIMGFNQGVVNPETPGDFDGSGMVGNGDLSLLLGSWGATPQGGWVNDLPPGAVGNDSLSSLLGNWGKDYTGGLSAVPEPSTLAIAMLATVSGLVIRRKR